MELLFRKFIISAMVGCIAWLLCRLLIFAYPVDHQLGIQLMLFGFFVSSSVASAESFYEVDRVLWKEAILAAILGLCLCALVGFSTDLALERTSTLHPIASNLIFYGPWLIVGISVGLSASFRPSRFSMERLRNGLIGGIVGGLAGAVLMFLVAPISSSPVFWHFVSAGTWAIVAGLIALGIGLAPMMTGVAQLVFRGSEAAGARAKLGRKGTIDLGTETICLGSRPLLAGQATVLLIPDPAVHPVHCFLVYNHGKYEVHYPADNYPGMPGYKPVFANRKPIPHQAPLKQGNLLRIGETEFELQVKTNEND